MTDLELNKYKQKLLTALSTFVSICEEHNLSYFCACGTVIGAIRHKGYIPWDDDIDVYMPHDDYYKFIELSQLPEGYKTVSIHNSDSFATFAKFYYTNTTLWEIKQIPFVYGIYIDIFPLYSTNGDKDIFFKKYKKLRLLQRKYQMTLFKPTLSDLLESILHKDKNMIIKIIVSFFVPSFLKKKYRNDIIAFENEMKDANEDGSYYASYYGDYWRKELFDKSWFDGFVIVPFENMSVRVCKGYDKYLRHLYGDYMHLPPADKQVSHHYHYYINMDKRMTLEEVKELMKKK